MTTAAILLALSCCVVGPALAKDFVFDNQHGSTVWVGILGNSGKGNPNNGGFALDPDRQVTVTTADDWAGRFWARTGCTFDDSGNGPCATGDCGNKLECNGAGGTPPVTLAEITCNGYGGKDYYDVSLVDGFNVPITISPQNDGVSDSDPYSCATAGCSSDLNPSCPSELQQTGSTGVVACKSSCLAFDTDEYCCRGAYGTPATCDPSAWQVNSAEYFEKNCPAAYSYAYDDRTSTYTCTDSAYVVTIG